MLSNLTLKINQAEFFHQEKHFLILRFFMSFLPTKLFLNNVRILALFMIICEFWYVITTAYSLVSRKVAVFTVSASNVTVIKATWWKTSFFRRVEFSENVCRSIAFCCKIQCVFKVCQCWHHFVVCHKTLKKNWFELEWIFGYALILCLILF